LIRDRIRRVVDRRLLLAVCVMALVAPSAAGAQSDTLSIDDAVAQALAANPRMVAARMGRAIGLASVGVARERPNPELLFEASRDTPHESLSTAWTIETAGKRARRIGVAQASVERADAELASVTAAVVTDVRRAFFALVAATDRVTLTDDVKALAGRARTAAHERYDAGDAPRLEALQADVVLAEAENEATRAAGLQGAARAELNVLLGRAPDSPVTPAGSSDLPPIPTADVATARALSINPELRVVDRQIAEGLARVELARALQHPDTTVDAGAVFDSPPDFQYGWRVGFSMTLPILTRHTAAVQVEDATVRQLRAERDATVSRIRGAVASAVARAAAQRQAYARYRDEILPRTEEVARMAEDSYRSGQTGLAALLLSLQGVRDIRLRALQASSDLQTAVTDLEQAIGAPVP